MINRASVHTVLMLLISNQFSQMQVQQPNTVFQMLSEDSIIGDELDLVLL